MMKDIDKNTDEEIVKAVQKGDKQAYGEIIRRYQTKIVRYATNLLDDEQAGADVAQEGFIKAYININSFNIKKQFSSWLYRIVHNEAMNWFNKHKRYKPILGGIDFDSGINVEDQYIKKELASQAQLCLQQIPVMYSEPLVLYYLDNKSYEDISDILKLPIGTVGTRINRAKGYLAKICRNRIK